MNVSMNSETKWLPDGFHFLGPTEAGNRRRLTDSWIQFLKDEGYSEVILPSMDYTTTFLNQIHPDESHAILSYRDLSGREISPGTDLTIQVVKGMAGLSHISENQNVFYLSKRIRDHRNRNASRREILQLGAEMLGSSSPQDIARILRQADRLLAMANLRNRPTIVLGNNYFIKKILERTGLGEEKLRVLSGIIDTKNAVALEEFFRDNRGEYRGDSSTAEREKGAILGLLRALEYGEVTAILSSIEGRDGAEFSKHLSDTKTVLNAWKQGNPYCDLCLDLSLVRDLKYYSGFLFQGFQVGETEPVLTGGQYDDLYEVFSGVKKNACGFAIHVDSLESSLL